MVRMTWVDRHTVRASQPIREVKDSRAAHGVNGRDDATARARQPQRQHVEDARLPHRRTEGSGGPAGPVPKRRGRRHGEGVRGGARRGERPSSDGQDPHCRSAPSVVRRGSRWGANRALRDP